MTNNHKPNQIDYVEFPAGSVADLERAKRFFAEVFAWSYQEWGAGYADTQSSGVSSGINADGGHRPRAPLPVVYTDDLESARARVVAAGGIITREIFSFPGGRRFHFTDPACNELGVWSEGV